ncbi:hypothetical protein [Halobacillus mangrovi]|uniref:NERD domain-containing protein n=1 Tax=Halobacillus mangrovi TaxID=402384 RepID=A0A1W5ZXJ3_9BACI|nr:hypothetical protein [Halobacillus mangrovi]ARI77989.1 hypothetical protein HM131_14520 [Halobacillus mangrovi]
MDYTMIFDIKVLLVVIAALGCFVLGLLLVLLNKSKKHREELIEIETEAISDLDKVEQEYKQKDNERDEKIKEEYEAKISEFKTYVHNIEEISKNSTDIQIHTLLTDLKEKLVREGVIKPLEMMVLSNVFLPMKTEKSEMTPNKINHIVLMRTGIYIIDNNEFYGNILHGLTRGKAKEFSFLFDHLSTTEEKEAEKTIIFENNNVDQTGMNVYSVKNPVSNLLGGVDYFKQLLRGQINDSAVTPILYFNHHDNSLINFSEMKAPYVFDDQAVLSKFFVRQLEKANTVYTEGELEKIKSTIENLNPTQSLSFNTNTLDRTKLQA